MAKPSAAAKCSLISPPQAVHLVSIFLVAREPLL